MKHIEEIAAKNQQKAWEIIRDTNVVDIWQDAGATINLVGSLKTGLLMKHRDIDFHIYTERLNVADSFSAMMKLAQHPRIKRIESRFPPDCLIIARLGFSKERIGQGTHFIRFLAGVAPKYGFNHIGIECANDKSGALAKKLGFYSIDGENYARAVTNLISYFSME